MVTYHDDDDQLPKARFAFIDHEPNASSWRVRSFKLVEKIAGPYDCELELVSEGADADGMALLNASCTLQIIRGGFTPRSIHGVAHRVIDKGTVSGHVAVKIHMGPALSVCAYGSNTRIFQNMTAPEIIEEVLKDRLLSYHRLLKKRLYFEGYACREFCVQYQESDLDFVHRLMREEGISYFFDQSDRIAELLVLVDSNEAFPTCKTLNGRPVPIAANSVVRGRVESLFSLEARRTLGPNRIVVRDFDWTRSQIDFSSELQKKEGRGLDYELYDHVPFDSASDYSPEKRRYTNDHLDRHAQVRLEQAQTLQKHHNATSNLTGLSAGMVLEGVRYNGAPTEKYLVCSIKHEGHSAENLGEAEEAQGAQTQEAQKPDYLNELVCISAKTPFRPGIPEGHESRPLVHGLVTATVVGPAGQEVATDKHGRVRVQFHWDRKGQRNEKSSCWVRVAQAWAGLGFGTLFIPRIGMEVVVQFIEGNPDRPLIIGAVYNDQNIPPLSLPAEKTRSTIRTAASPGVMHVERYNEIRFEDERGSEEIYVHAQNDMNEEVGHDHKVDIGNDETLTVAKNQTEDIGADQTVDVHGSRTKTVDKNEKITVQGGRSTSVAKNDSLSIDGSHDVNVTKDVSETFQAKHTRVVSGKQDLTVHQDKDEHITGVFKLTTDKEYQLTQGGTTLEFQEGKVVLKADGEIKIVHEGGVIEIAKNGSIKITSSQKVEIDGGGTKVTLKSGKAVVSSSTVTIG